ncbi:MAG: hypothetical protein QOE93_1442 [Actinomycetota bacterium]|nr:hypothetical protein [Actinomycetota bacterium]
MALRTILQAWDGEGMADNVAEMRIVRLFAAAGIPELVRQYEIHDDGEFVARADLAAPWAKLAIEMDSFRWHAGRGPFRSDRARANRITAAGWHLLRAVPEDAADPRNLIRAASRILSVAA